eukprot:TRINITY_DN3069_c0_g3_i3.p1 TRINITY_DN3069_c0_g3~~TRINITY_DN3069_c0_g3_i3.p1  ORF type:complete len:740 (+),score=108.04 TRINITY_DN3069_c0_g3_i3:145-2364(+)
MPAATQLDLNPKTLITLKKFLPQDVFDSIRYCETVIEYDNGKKAYKNCIVTPNHLYLIPLQPKKQIANPTLSFCHVHEVLLNDHGARLSKDGPSFLDEKLSANSIHIVLTFYKDATKRNLGELHIFTFLQDSKVRFHIEESWKAIMLTPQSARQPAPKEKKKTLDIEQLRVRFRELENELITPDKQDDARFKCNLIEELYIAATRHAPLKTLFFESELIFSFIIEEVLFFLTPPENRPALFLRQSIDASTDFGSSSGSTSPRTFTFRKQRRKALHRISYSSVDFNSSISSRSSDRMSISQMSTANPRGASRPSSVVSFTASVRSHLPPAPKLDKNGQLERIERNALKLPPLGANTSLAAAKLADSLMKQPNEPFVTPETIGRPPMGRYPLPRRAIAPALPVLRSNADATSVPSHVPRVIGKPSPSMKPMPAPSTSIPHSISNSSLAAAQLPKVPGKGVLPPLPQPHPPPKQKLSDTTSSLGQSIDLTATMTPSEFGDLNSTSGDQMSRSGTRYQAMPDSYRPPTGRSITKPSASPNVPSQRGNRPVPPATPAAPPSVRSSLSQSPSDRLDSSIRKQILPPVGLTGQRDLASSIEKEAANRVSELQYVVELMRLLLFMLRGSDSLPERLNIVKRSPPCTINELTQAMLTASDPIPKEKGQPSDLINHQTSITRLLVSILFEVIDGVFRQAKTEKIDFRLHDYLTLVTKQPFFETRLTGFMTYLLELYSKCSAGNYDSYNP